MGATPDDRPASRAPARYGEPGRSARGRPTRVLTGIERAATELGFSLLLSILDRLDPERMDAIINDLLSRQVDGVLWAVPGHVSVFEWLADRLGGLAVPTVFLNKRQDPGQQVVAMDNRLGSRLAVEHLLEQGYRRIGIIKGPEGWWEAREREAGWRATMEEAGIDSLGELEAEGDWSAASGDAGFHSLFARSSGLDAVYACNDQMALGALRAARQLGLEIPRELAVVGFDDIPEAAYFSPALTTVHQDPRELGALAVERMNQMIQARRKDRIIEPAVSWVRPQLVIRGSSIRERAAEKG